MRDGIQQGGDLEDMASGHLESSVESAALHMYIQKAHANFKVVISKHQQLNQAWELLYLDKYSCFKFL